VRQLVSFERRTQIVLLEKQRHTNSTPARIQERPSDGERVEFLHGDVELRASALDEVDDDRLEVVRGPPPLDLPIGKGRHEVASLCG
jgi:hypothetical protein